MSLVFLCGLKDCGKTTVLDSLINKYNVYGCDVDREILSSFKLVPKASSIRQLYSILGEKTFREEEKKAVDSIILKYSRTNCIVALGGGACECEGLLQLCRNCGAIVYLYQKPDVLYSRMEAEGLPSFIKGKEDFEKLFKSRDSKYSAYCNKKIDMTLQSMERICQILLELYLN